MGCHTWMYKVCQTPLEELKQEAYNNVERFGIDYLAASEVEKKKIVDDLGYTEEEILEGLKMDKILLKKIAKGHLSSISDNIYDRIIRHHKGILYENVAYNECFRVGDYPSTKLFSLQETLDFIEKRKNGKGKKSIYFYNNYLENIKKFWDKYPDGMIRFG